ncbi:hypothetical protein O181_000071 [Austropuccinia psidii MF-1]|uniref:Uncharacterized protein n=1 Tax=Austropuccinia psidii MF-1 TaxID=1389203 RepID=A0A9Q3B879_9BASI|nr:hypothetical protein [Austropuccinia psidii MF-1]
MVTSQKLQPVARSSGRREDQSPLPLPFAQVFQTRDNWSVWVTREDTNIENEGQDAVGRFLRGLDENSREVIAYDNDRMILVLLLRRWLLNLYSMNMS